VLIEGGRGGPSDKSHQGLTPSASSIDRPARTALWGVLNVTPDSFSDGGAFLQQDQAVEHALRLLRDGADVVDVGGESSRPAGKTYGVGFEPVGAEEELRRVLPVVEALVSSSVVVSVDTVKAEVARAVLKAGASIVNDVSCGRSRALLEAVAEAGAELVLMHNRGRGECRGENVLYRDVVEDVRDELLQALERAERCGVPRTHIWLDPGLGFAKTATQSLQILCNLGVLLATGQRVLVGPSRKSFIAEFARERSGEIPPPGRRLGGTAAAVTMCVLAGAQAVRVHDVAEMHQVVGLSWATRGAGR
jgi:dihydropteroate synthase